MKQCLKRIKSSINHALVSKNIFIAKKGKSNVVPVNTT